jgi:hypothetical protein
MLTWRSLEGIKKRRAWRKLTVAGDGGAGCGGEGPLGEAELRGGEEVADGLVGRAGVAEAVQPQNEAPVASHHVGGGDELGRKAGRRRAAAKGGGEEGGCANGRSEGEEEADQATHGSWAEPGRKASLRSVCLSAMMAALVVVDR